VNWVISNISAGISHVFRYHKHGVLCAKLAVIFFNSTDPIGHVVYVVELKLLACWGWEFEFQWGKNYLSLLIGVCSQVWVPAMGFHSSKRVLSSVKCLNVTLKPFNEKSLKLWELLGYRKIIFDLLKYVLCCYKQNTWRRFVFKISKLKWNLVTYLLSSLKLD